MYVTDTTYNLKKKYQIEHERTYSRTYHIKKKKKKQFYKNIESTIFR